MSGSGGGAIHRDVASKFVSRTLEWVRTNVEIGRRYGTPRGLPYAVTSRHLRVPLCGWGEIGQMGQLGGGGVDFRRKW
jgi:hypothetical protein